MHSKLLGLVLIAAVAAVACADDEPRSENQAKTVRKADGSFTKVPEKKEDKGKDSPQPNGAKPGGGKEATATIDASEMAKLKELVGKEAVVKGKVHEVFVPASGNVAVLNLGPDFKTCFKVAIFKANFGKFGGLDEIKKQFKDKKVQVEGKVELYREQPQIVVTVPSQLKVSE